MSAHVTFPATPTLPETSTPEEFDAIFEKLVPRAVRHACRPLNAPASSSTTTASKRNSGIQLYSSGNRKASSISGSAAGGEQRKRSSFMIPRTLSMKGTSEAKQGPMKKESIPVKCETGGVMVIVDVSGYTSLTEMLFDVNDNAGGERVYNIVNPFFDGLIKTIEKYQGQVVKFCGDSLIASWITAEGSPIFNSTALSLLCSVDIMQEFEEYDVELPHKPGETPKYHTMSVHIGIGCGSIHHLFVGHESRAEYVITGEAITTASRLLTQTKRGEIALSLAVAEMILPGKNHRPHPHSQSSADHIILTIDTINASEWAASIGKLRQMDIFNDEPYNLPLALKATPKQFVNDRAVARLMQLARDHGVPYASNSDLALELNELRKITVVFIQLRSNALSSGSAADSLQFCQTVMSSIAAPIAKYQGTLRQMVYDDKSFTILLVWGLPPSSHMDEAFGLMCALSLRDIFRSMFSNNFSIGVSAGPCYTGIIGNRMRSDHNLFGRALNLAARCMSIPMAKGNIVCDSSISETTRKHFTFGDSTMISVKGVSQPLSVSLLLNEDTNSLNRAQNMAASGGKAGGAHPLIGREAELQVVNQCILQWLRLGQQRTLLCLGDSGCGKTSLGSYVESTLMEFTERLNDFRVYMEAKERAKKSMMSMTRGSIAFGANSFVAAAQNFMNHRSSYTGTGSGRASLEEREEENDDGSPREYDTSNQWTPLKGSFTEKVYLVAKAFQIDPDQMPLLNDLVTDCTIPETKETLAMNPMKRRNLNFKILVFMLTASYKILGLRFAFMIDNSQWCDSLSWNTIRSMLAKTPFIFLVLLSRKKTDLEKEDVAELESVEHHHSTVQLTLGNLSEDSTGRLLEMLLNTKIHDSVKNMIYEKTGGVPMVVELCAKSLSVPGVLRYTNGVAEFSSDAVDRLFTNQDLSSIIAPQFDRLSVRFQHLLKFASVAGMSFRLTLLCDLINSSSANDKGDGIHQRSTTTRNFAAGIKRAVEENRRKFSVTQGLLSPISESCESLISESDLKRVIEEDDKYGFLVKESSLDLFETYSFRHVYIQKGIYDLLLQESKEDVHYFAFTWLEEHLSFDHLEATTTTLAIHSNKKVSPTSAVDTSSSDAQGQNASEVKPELEPVSLYVKPASSGKGNNDVDDETARQFRAKVNFLLEASYHLEKCSDQVIDSETRAGHMQRQIDFFWAVQVCPEAIRIYDKLCNHWERYPGTASDYIRGKYAAIVSDCHYNLMREEKMMGYMTQALELLVGLKTPKTSFDKIVFILKYLGKARQKIKQLKKKMEKTGSFAQEQEFTPQSDLDAERTYLVLGLFNMVCLQKLDALLPALGEDKLASFYYETITQYIDNPDSYGSECNVDLMNLLFWTGITAFARDLQGPAERYLSWNINLGNELNLSLTKSLTSCLTYMRSIMQFQGRFSELQPFINQVANRKFVPTYFRKYAYGDYVGFEAFKLHTSQAKAVWTEMDDMNPLPSLLQRDLLLITFNLRLAEYALFFDKFVPALHLSSHKTRPPNLQHQLLLYPRLPSESDLAVIDEIQSKLLNHSHEMSKLFTTPFGPNAKVFMVFSDIVLWTFLHYASKLRVQHLWIRIQKAFQEAQSTQDTAFQRHGLSSVKDSEYSPTTSLEKPSPLSNLLVRKRTVVSANIKLKLPMAAEPTRDADESFNFMPQSRSEIELPQRVDCLPTMSQSSNMNSLDKLASLPDYPNFVFTPPNQIPNELQDPTGFDKLRGRKTAKFWATSATQWAATTKAPFTPLLQKMLKGAIKAVLGDFAAARAIWTHECLPDFSHDISLIYQKALLESHIAQCEAIHFCLQRASKMAPDGTFRKRSIFTLSKRRSQIHLESSADEIVQRLQQTKECLLTFGEMSNLPALIIDSVIEATCSFASND
ncbi:Adenylate cyclase type 10 [Chytridiales sp. JEL 0842]|nr:Adenylate cyclase type 10 [Chytridiales sp. JEL 0842]